MRMMLGVSHCLAGALHLAHLINRESYNHESVETLLFVRLMVVVHE